MAQKLKSFEQFVTEMDRAEEIEKDIVDQGKPEEHSAEEADAVQQANEAEAGVDAEDLDGKTKDVSGKIEFDDKEVDQSAKDDSAELNKDLKGEDEAGKEVNEDEEKEEEKEEEAETPETTKEAPEATEGEEPKTAIDLMKECMEAMKNEAKAWEGDEHDEHTVETYMCEAASLMGNYAANSLKSLKEDYELEAYEAACNSIKESFCKKVDEAKEANMAPSNQAPEADEDPAAKA